MAESKKQFGLCAPRSPLASEERRRLSRIVHDERGNASVVWEDAPSDYERPVFEVQDSSSVSRPPRRGIDTGSLSIKTEDNHNPYERVPEVARKSGTGTGTRTDLRKLSAWIKLMRQIEEHKRRDGGEDD